MSHANRSRRPRRSLRIRTWRSHLEYLEVRMAPAVFAVSPSAADGAPGSLRYAINQADDNGDASNVITLAIGTYALTDATDGNLLVQDKASGVSDKSLTIIGQGETNTIIEPHAAATSGFRVFEIVSTAGAGVSVLFQNLTISGGIAQGGGVIGGAAALGGGLLIDGGAVTLSHVAVSNNQALGASGAHSPSRAGANALGGGIFLASGSLIVASSSVSDNSAKAGNGGHGVTGTDAGGHTSHGATGSAGAGGAAGRAGVNGSGGVRGGGGGAGQPGGDGQPGGPAPNNGTGGLGGAGGNGSGGGIYVAGGTVVLASTTFSGNVAQGGAGGMGGQGGGAVVVGYEGEGGAGGQGGTGGDGGAGGRGGAGTGQSGQNGGPGGAGGYGAVGGKGNSGGNGANGGNGGPGGPGGNGYGGGLYLESGSISANALLLTLNTAGGGAGGHGGNGFKGGEGGVGGNAGEPGAGERGGAGGAGAGNTIGNGGAGGSGSKGGAGGNGLTGGNGGNGGQAGNGAPGGQGGNGMGGAAYVASGELTISLTTLKKNTASGGIGGVGGAGGKGGQGGEGADLFKGTTAGGGGVGGSGGNGGAGGKALHGVGTGGDGGNGAQGGAGGAGANGGKGGNAGNGGAGAQAGNGGDGDGGGIAVVGGSLTLFDTTLSGNSALGAAGGTGGQGGEGGEGGFGGRGAIGGHGGEGGQPGNAGAGSGAGHMGAAGSPGAGGNGGAGGIGGNGGNGGYGGAGATGGTGGVARGAGVYLTGGTVTIANSTLYDNQAISGVAGTGGNGGAVKYLIPNAEAPTSSIRENYGGAGAGGPGGAAGLGGHGLGHTGAPGKTGANGAKGDNGLTGISGAGGSSGMPGRSFGGGIFVSGGSIAIEHATIVDNYSGLDNGSSTQNGSQVFQSGGGGVTANSSIFGGEADGDFRGYGGNVNAVNCLFGTGPSGTLTGTGNQLRVQSDLSASGLQNNGGPVQTIAPANPGPAIGQASNPQSFLTDERGYALPGQSGLDAGADQTGAIAEVTQPTASLTAPGVTLANAAASDPYTFTIVYGDNVAVDQASVPGTIVAVEPPGGGAPLTATLVSVTPSDTRDGMGNATSETALYRLTPPGGSWSTAVSGTYTVMLVGAPVTDLAGNAVQSGTLGTFSAELGPDHLAVVTEPPGTIQQNTIFGTAVVALNSQDNVLTGFNGNLTITLSANPGSSNLGGTLIVTASDGVASFANLTLDSPGAGYVLLVTSSGPLSPAATTPFNVAFGPTPPSVLSTQAIKKKGALREIVVHYSTAMDTASTLNMKNYVLVDAGRDHIFSTRGNRVVAWKSASYDPADDSVTLILKKPDTLKDSLRLTINAQPPAGVQSAVGEFLNSSLTGASGPNAVLYYGKPPRSPKPKGLKAGTGRASADARTLHRESGAVATLHPGRADGRAIRDALPIALEARIVDALLASD